MIDRHELEKRIFKAHPLAQRIFTTSILFRFLPIIENLANNTTIEITREGATLCWDLISQGIIFGSTDIQKRLDVYDFTDALDSKFPDRLVLIALHILSLATEPEYADQCAVSASSHAFTLASYIDDYLDKYNKVDSDANWYEEKANLR